MKSYLYLILICLVSGCSLLRPAPRFVLSDEQANQLLYSIKSQNDMTHTLVSSGTINLRDQGQDFEARFFFIGTKDPMRIKIEIIHSWGRPLLYFLLKEKGFKLVDHTRKRTYMGSLDNPCKVLFLPGPTGPRQIWSIFRGYPEAVEHDAYKMPGPASISLLDHNGKEVEKFFFDLESFLPRTVWYHNLKLAIQYNNFTQLEKYTYARKVKVQETSSDRQIVLMIKKILFNKPIPEQIFNLDIPSEYETINLR